MQGRHASQNWNGMHYEKKYDLPYLLKTTLPTCFEECTMSPVSQTGSQKAGEAALTVINNIDA